MAIRYYKLFDLLNRKGMKKSDLRKIISSSTVAKLSKGEYISGEAIEKICEFLNCQPGDIMERVDEETNIKDFLKAGFNYGKKQGEKTAEKIIDSKSQSINNIENA